VEIGKKSGLGRHLGERRSVHVKYIHSTFLMQLNIIKNCKARMIKPRLSPS